MVHATHNVTVDSNVAFNTSGHCFMTEEGGEMDNTFVNNLGMLTFSGEALSPLTFYLDIDLIYTLNDSRLTVSQKISTDETDDSPSTFWISSLKNNFTGNVGAGSSDSG